MITPLVLATDDDDAAELAAALGARALPVPAPDHLEGDWEWGAALEDWRAATAEGPRTDRVVVAVWSAPTAATGVVELDVDDWLTRAEAPLAVWVAALGVARARCADGGAIVAVVERPSPLDCAGRGPETAAADAVEALVRSLARSEGPRGVRVNLVTTPRRLAPEQVVAPAPSLATYPGTVAAEVAGAVRLLLSDDGAGVTGTAVHADCGRSWR